MNIVLTGFMGTGKSTVAQLLSVQRGWPLYDTDEVIEKMTAMKIPDIFKQFGEPYFRDREHEAVKSVAALDNAVISCGGGVVLRPENMTELEKNGVVVCLSASPEVILARTAGSSRPLLAVADPLAKIRELLQQREPFYHRCHVRIDTSSLNPGEVVAAIVAHPRVAR